MVTLPALQFEPLQRLVFSAWVNDTVFAWLHGTDSFLCVAVSKYILKYKYKYVQLTLAAVKNVYDYW